MVGVPQPGQQRAERESGDRRVDQANAEASLAYAGVGATQDVLALDQLEEEGMTIYALSPEERQAFRDATAKPLREWAIDEYGDEFAQGFFDYLDSFDKAP